MPQFDEVASSYAEMIQLDPVKLYVQRPFALKLLGSVKNKLILDVGCGDGTVAAMLVKKGARVVGYDNAQKQIKLAKLRNSAAQIEYFCATPASFSYPAKFDAAVSVMVLLYSKDIIELQSFFDSTYACLKDDGLFSIIDLDISKLRFGVNQLGRRFSRLPDEKLKIDFVTPGAKQFSSISSLFSLKQFESCARKAGFRKVSWKKLSPNVEGKRVVPKEFWDDFRKYSYWIGAVFQK